MVSTIKREGVEQGRGRRRKPGLGLLSALFFLLLSLAGCQDPFALEDLIDGPDGKPLTISPTSVVLTVNSSISVETSGGIPPYSYSVVSGSGSFSGNLYTAPPVPGSEAIEVRDDAGNRVSGTFTIDAGGLGLGITPVSQTVYTGQSVSFSAIGGSGPYSFAVTTDNSGALISGSTYTAGSVGGVTDTVTVTDSVPDTASTTVNVVAKPLSISPGTITVYVNQTVDFIAVGGDGSFSYEVTTNGSGSPSATATGVGAGVPFAYTAGPNPGTDTITMTDAYDGRIRTATVTVVASPVVTNVDYSPTAIINVSPAVSAQTSTAFTADFSIDNNGSAAGSEDIFWRIYASADTAIGGSDFIVDYGTIAGGSAGGSSTPVSINGTWPSVPGDYYLLADVAAADDLTTADNQSQSAGQVDVYAPLSMTPPLIDLYAGQQVTFSTTGGSGSYSYAITTDGSTNPVLSGALYTAGDNAGTDVVTVTDTTHAITASSTINVSTAPLSTSVDYSVGVPSNLVSTNLSGSSLDGDFNLDNIGTANGGYVINWTLYASANTVLGPQDFVIDSGSETQLTASSGTTVLFSGLWPSVADNYYLIVQIEALDDNNTANNRSVTLSQTAVSGSGPLDVEYVIPTVTDPGAAVLTGSPLNESFDLQNSGSEAGSADVYWTAYLSADATLDISIDTPIDSGIHPALGAGGSSTGIAVAGSWPQTAGTWYLIVSESASDEQTAGNIGVSAAVTVNDPEVDYRIPAINVTGTPALIGTAVSADFQIENISTDTGTATIYWTAYASLDTVINSGFDPIIDTGVITADISGGALTALQTIDGTWPSTAGEYYVLVKLYSGDDVNPANDQQQSGPHTISLPDVEYEVSSISAVNTTPDAGSVIAESFTLQNTGADAGSSSLNWYVYLSDDGVYDAGGDLLIDSGSVAALDGDDSVPGSGPDETTVAINANWPTSAGTWYLIVRESADDEGVPGQWLASAPFSVQPLSLDVDYYVSVLPAGGSAQVSTGFSETFTISNQGSEAGGGDISWSAYLSDDPIYNAGDTFIDGGIYPGGLGSGANSGSISIDGTWPASPGGYYLIIRLQAPDESAVANNIGVGPVYFISDPGIIDYVPGGISRNFPVVTTDSLISESFTITNAGGVNGAADVSWTAYASLDQIPDAGEEVGGGIIPGGLSANTSLNGINIVGSWPSVPGEYYLIVETDAADETNHNDYTVSSGRFSVEGPPDYELVGVSFPAGGEPGGLFNLNFTIHNLSSYDGRKSISWQVLLSKDPYIGGDLLVDSGVTGALKADNIGTDDEALISLSGKSWPVTSDLYYLLILLDADDDADSSNDFLASSVLEVYYPDSENADLSGASNDGSGPEDPPPAISIAPTQNVGTLALGQTIVVRGWNDGDAGYDTYDFTIGAGVTTVSLYAVWSTGADDIDLYLWDSSGFEADSIAAVPDREPATGALRVSGWSSPEPAYAGVKFFSGTLGDPYTLYIKGE